MEGKIYIFIDGENISANYADRIIKMSNRLGYVTERRVYHRRRDKGTRAWSEKARAGGYKDVSVYGPPEKNKVDHIMQDEIRKYLKRSDVYMICVVTSDGGFRCLADDAVTAGKKLCFIVGKKPSKKLCDMRSEYMRLC